MKNSLLQFFISCKENIIHWMTKWNKIMYGEILKTLPMKTPILYIIFSLFFYMLFFLSLGTAGSLLGVYFAILFLLSLCWNILLDPYTGNRFNKIRAYVVQCEHKYQEQEAIIWKDKIAKILFSHFRITLLLYSYIFFAFIVGGIKLILIASK